MANVAKNAILRAKLAGVLTDLMPKTITDNVYVNDTTTLTTHLATLAAKADLETLQQTVNALGALAQKDKVSQADLDEALAAVIASKAEQSALTEEINRAKAAEEANASAAAAAQTAAENAQTAADTAQAGVNTLVGEDTGKSVRTIANEELAAQLIGENAKESMDTLAEIAAWIQEHPEDAAAMNAAIKALQDTAAGLGAMATKDIVSESDLDEALAEKVNASAEANHTHANGDVLDGITADVVAGWNGKGNIYFTATEPANLTENDLWVALVE